MAQRERWPLWLPVLLGGGIGLYFVLPFEPPMWSGWLSAVLFIGVSWVSRGKTGLSVLFLALCVISLGLGLSSLRTWWVAAPVLTKTTKAISLRGQVERLEILDKGLRVTLSNLYSSRLDPDGTPQKVRIKLNGEQPTFTPGDWLEVRTSLRPPPPPAMPGAFDFQRQSYFRALGGVGFAYGPAKVVGHAPTTGISSLAFWFESLRTEIAQRVRAALPVQTGAVAAALMTGERGAIEQEILEDMRASGLAHLLAISGLHVGLIAGIVFFALRAGFALIPAVSLRYPIKKWAAGGAIWAAFAYAMLAGATVPTQRAFLMISLVFLAVLFERKAISMRLVAWASVVILIFAPESLLGASFQMSFAAVVALVAVYEALQRRTVFTRRGDGLLVRVMRYVGGVAVTTLVAGLATGIFAAYHFNRVADFGLVANLIAVPVTALWIMPWAIVAYVLMPLGLEGWGLTPMGWGIDIVVATAHEVGHWPGAVSHVSAFPVWGLALMALGGLWLALWQGRLRLWGAGLAGLGMISFGAERAPDILIHGDGKLAAVHTTHGQYQFSTLTAAKFERATWLRRAGLDLTGTRWPVQDGALRCDALGCVYQMAGQSVAIAHSLEAAQEDCWMVDVLITATFDQTCAGRALHITQQDLSAKGTHAIWLGETGEAIRIKSVADGRGNRPWVLKSIK